LTIGGGLPRSSGCGTSHSYFPSGQILLLVVVLAGALAGWWTRRTAGPSWQESTLAGLLTGALAGLVPFLALSSTLSATAPGCPQAPAYIRDNYGAIMMQTRISALIEFAALGALGGALASGKVLQARRRSR